MQEKCDKKGISLILCLTLLLFVISCTQGPPEKETACLGDLVSLFPTSLQTVEDNAFSGTAIQAAAFYDGLVLIGESAFQNTPMLTDIYIPPSTEFIGRNALPDYVLIHGAEESYVQEWALANEVSFTADNIWNTKTACAKVHPEQLFSLLCFVLPYDHTVSYKIKKRMGAYVKSMRPQERPELYPINYRFP